MRDRVLGAVGLVMLAGALVWALAGDDAEPVGSLVVIGLGSVIADAIVWRFAERDLDVPGEVTLPSAPWGLVVGPAGALGLATAVILGVPLLAVTCAMAFIATLPGLYTRFPAGALPLRVVADADRVRRFAEAHGVSRGETVAGYVAPVGQNGARLVVVAPDSAWASLMIGQRDVDLVAHLARVELRDRTSPEAGRDLATGGQYWASMNKSW
ncbi:MAG TPA: hypothetical protein VFZ72_17540 [Jiangellaceae bacterium]